MKYILSALIALHQALTAFVVLALIAIGSYLFSNPDKFDLLRVLGGAGIGLVIGLVYAGFVVSLGDIRRRLLRIEHALSQKGM